MPKFLSDIDQDSNDLLNSIHQHPATDISDSTSVGRSILTANSQSLAMEAALVPEGRAYAGSTTYLWLPNFCGVSVATVALNTNRLYYAPIYVSTQVTLSAITFAVTTLASSSSVRVGIYNADTNWQPASLLVDAGTASSASTGVKDVSTSQVLNPGRYLMTLISNGAPTLRIIRGGITPIDDSMGSSPTIKSLYVSSTYGALPSTPVLWNNTTNGTTPFEHFLFLRVATP